MPIYSKRRHTILVLFQMIRSQCNTGCSRSLLTKFLVPKSLSCGAAVFLLTIVFTRGTVTLTDHVLSEIEFCKCDLFSFFYFSSQDCYTNPVILTLIGLALAVCFSCFSLIILSIFVLKPHAQIVIHNLVGVFFLSCSIWNFQK